MSGKSKLAVVLAFLFLMAITSCAPQVAKPVAQAPAGGTLGAPLGAPAKVPNPPDTSTNEGPQERPQHRSPQGEQIVIGSLGVKYGMAGWQGWGSGSGSTSLDLDFRCLNPSQDGGMPGGKRAPRTTITESGDTVTFRFDDVSWPRDSGEDIAVKAPYAGMLWDGARLTQIIRAEEYLEISFKVYGSYAYITRDTTTWGESYPDAIGVSIDFSPVRHYPDGVTVAHRTSKALDLMLHIYAHLDMGSNAATNYDPEYIERIRQVKMNESSVYREAILDLEKELSEMSEWAKRDMRPVYLAMLSVYIEDPSDLVAGLRALAGQTELLAKLSPTEAATVSALSERLRLSRNEREIVGRFADIVSREFGKFYSRHHSTMELEYDDRADAFRSLMSTIGVKAIAPYLKRGGKPNLSVWLSEGRRVAGWGIMDGYRVGAVVPLPEEGEDGYRTYFWMVHEITHGLCDPIVLKATGLDAFKRDTARGSKGYEVHQALEAGVILADYWIFKTYGDELCARYLEWCRRFSTSDPLSVPLDDSLKEIIREEFSRR
ncbi:MAG: hypothetical protein ACM3WU_01855 [Bacillota bacterium]